VSQLGGDGRLRGLDLIKPKEPVVVDCLGVLGQVGVGQNVVPVDLVTIGQIADAGAGATLRGLLFEHLQPCLQRRLDVLIHGRQQHRALGRSALAIIIGDCSAGVSTMRRVWSMQRSTTSAGAVRPAIRPSATLAWCAAIQPG